MGQNFRVPIRSWKTAMVISGCNLNSCYGGTTSLRARSPERTGGGRENSSARAPKRDCSQADGISGPFYTKSFVTPLLYHRNGLNNLGPVPRKMIKFNPGLSQILGKVFCPRTCNSILPRDTVMMTQNVTQNNTQEDKIQKRNKNFNPGLALIGLSGTGPWTKKVYAHLCLVW